MFSIPADSADHGGIARPDLRGSGWPPPGGAGQYQAIDQDDPRFRIHNYLNTPAQGTTLEKVGSATGWTTGDVDSTCETRAFDNELTPLYWMVCVYEAGMYSQDGDSGGPVFAWTNQSDSVSLVGTIIGWGEGSTYFNSVGAIRDEFGEFQFEDKPLDVFIPGPWEASPNEPCTFYSNPSGGAIPYSFEWIGELTGYTQNITGTMETSGYLTVRVTDAEQNQASDSKWIDVDEFNFCVY